jgi:hypothetical protein
MRRNVPRLQMLGPVLLLCALALAAGLGTGCSNEPTKPEPKPTPEPLALSADQLITLLRDAYTSMDIDAYRALLHTDFIFKFQQWDVDNLGLPSDHLVREDDLASTQNLFSGQPVGGEPGVSRITWSLMEGIGVWEASANQEFPGAMRRLYNFGINITRPGSTTLIIEGQQEFYATSRDTTINGTPASYWKLVGQVDLSYSGGWKGTEDCSWGRVKVLYRPPET